MVFLNAGNGSTSLTTLQPMGSPITVTPRSVNSTLIVEATFNGTISDNDTTGANSSAYFVLREVTGAAVNIGFEHTLTASSDNSSPNGIACSAPCAVRASVANGVVTARSFRLYGRANTVGATVTATANYIFLTVTEIQN